MRKVFADKYNLVTIQCDYFGWKFMQGSNSIFRYELAKYFNNKEIEYIFSNNIGFYRSIEIASKYKINIKARENLEQSLDNYNEKGLIQGIYNISAVISVMKIIKGNGYKFS